MIIDAHHHFWRYNPHEYGWIDDRMRMLQRDFVPADLLETIRSAGVSGVVTVQARQNIEETNWLLALAQEHSFIRGVVGWLPLVRDDVEGQLQRLSQTHKLCALRHVVQDEPDDQFILREDFNRGLARLHRFRLAYDILIFERHLPYAIEFVDRHPKQVFVLDHIAKPQIRSGSIEFWKRHLIELARRPNIYCKISGMVTEADWTRWTPAQLQPFFNAALDAFTPRRLMFGSDWPVCLVATDYQDWLQTVQGWTGSLSNDERDWIFWRTATQAYRLEPA